MSYKKANIRVTLQPRSHTYTDAIDVTMEIDDLVGVVENEPADFHCITVPPGYKPILRVIEHHIGLIKSRKDTAKYIADILTIKIMECLGKDDKINGYSKNEWNKGET